VDEYKPLPPLHLLTEHHGVAHIPEHHLKGVALHVDFLPVVQCDELADDAVVHLLQPE